MSANFANPNVKKTPLGRYKAGIKTKSALFEQDRGF